MIYVYLNLTESILCRIEIISAEQPELHSVTFYSCSRTQTEFSQLLGFLYEPNLPLRMAALSAKHYRSSQSHKRYKSLIYDDQQAHTRLHPEKKYKAFQHMHLKFDTFSPQLLSSLLARLLHFQNRTVLRALQKKFLYLDQGIDLPDQYLKSPIISVDSAVEILDTYRQEYAAENSATCKSSVFLNKNNHQCDNFIIKDRYDSLQTAGRQYPELEFKANQTEFFYSTAIQAYEEGRSFTYQQTLMAKIAGFALLLLVLIGTIVYHIKKSSQRSVQYFSPESLSNTLFDSPKNALPKLPDKNAITPSAERDKLSPLGCS